MSGLATILGSSATDTFFLLGSWCIAAFLFILRTIMITHECYQLFLSNTYPDHGRFSLSCSAREERHKKPEESRNSCFLCSAAGPAIVFMGFFPASSFFLMSPYIIHFAGDKCWHIQMLIVPCLILLIQTVKFLFLSGM